MGPRRFTASRLYEAFKLLSRFCGNRSRNDLITSENLLLDLLLAIFIAPVWKLASGYDSDGSSLHYDSLVLLAGIDISSLFFDT